MTKRKKPKKEISNVLKDYDEPDRPKRKKFSMFS